MRFLLIFVFFSLLILGLPSVFSQSASLPVRAFPSSTPEFKMLLPHPLKTHQWLAASNAQILESVENGLWKPLWTFNSPVSQVKKIISVPSQPEWVFILTDQGAYRGNLKTLRWEKFFSALSLNERPLAFHLNPDSKTWFLGTARGLFITKDEGKTWFSPLTFKNKKVSLLHFSNTTLLAGAGQSLYQSENGSDFREIFSFGLVSDEGDETEPQSDGQEESDVSFPMFHDYLAVGGQEWLGTSKGVFQKISGHWQRLPCSGLIQSEVLQLAYDAIHARVLGRTAEGIWEWDQPSSRWRKLYKNLPTHSIHSFTVLEQEGESFLAVISTGGLTVESLNELRERHQSFWLPNPQRDSVFQKITALEPAFSELRQAILRFQDLEPDKISRWQKQSRWRAALPHLSFSKSLSRGNSIDIDRGSTSDSDRYITGPDDISRNWDFDVSWELGDLIWGTAQTSIDSRSKIDAEFRQSLLMEAARIYYERRRLQMEMFFYPASSGKESFEQSIHLEELTALLDSMSGGYLTLKLTELYRKYPELNPKNKK